MVVLDNNSFYSTQNNRYVEVVIVLLASLLILMMILIWGIPYISTHNLITIFQDIFSALTVERIK